MAATPNLSFLLGQTGHALETELAAALGCMGISPRSYCVLSKALVGDLTQSKLAELSGLDKTTMVVTMDELERSGLAERTPSSVDRRARVISVTAKGRTVIAAADEVVAHVHRDVLAALPVKDRAVFVASLERLLADRLSKPTPCDRAVRRRSVSAVS